MALSCLPQSLMLAWGMYPAWRGVRPGDDPTTPLGSAESRLTWWVAGREAMRAIRA